MSDKKVDWLDSNGELNEELFRKGTFPEDYKGPVYATPDWVRHPERYPELMARMQEWGKKWNFERKD